MALPVAKRDFELLSGPPKEWRRRADSGNEVSCYFCPVCGSRIYHGSSQKPDYWHLKAGTLDDTSWLEPVAQAWTSSAQPWLRLANEMASFSGQPENLSDLVKR
jgi:hypothetical protein